MLGHAGIDFVIERFREARYRGAPPSPEDRARIEEITASLLRKPPQAPTPG